MALRFQATESVPDGIRRMLLEALDRVQTNMDDSDVRDRVAVHRARRGCKRIRALLRLVRTDLGERWRLEDRCYGDLSRALSHARQADVYLATLARVRAEYGELIRPRCFKVARRELEAYGSEMVPRPGRLRKDASAELHGARDRLRKLPLGTDGFGAIAPGLADSYSKAARRVQRAARTDRAEHFHALRKHVKYLFYQVGTLRSAAPLQARALRAQLSTIGGLLGDSQDLFDLRNALRRVGATPELEVVAALADLPEARLHRQVLDKAGPLFGGPAEDFVGDLEPHWILWKEEGRDASAEAPKPVPLRPPASGRPRPQPMGRKDKEWRGWGSDLREVD